MQCFVMLTCSIHFILATLWITHEYLLQFLSLNIDSDVYWEFFVTSPCTTSVQKQTPDVTYREKRRCGRCAELSFYADLTQFTLSLYIFWLARYMNFLVNVRGSVGTDDTPSAWHKLYYISLSILYCCFFRASRFVAYPWTDIKVTL